MDLGIPGIFLTNQELLKNFRQIHDIFPKFSKFVTSLTEWTPYLNLDITWTEVSSIQIEKIYTNMIEVNFKKFFNEWLANIRNLWLHFETRVNFENSNSPECDIDKDKLGRYLEILGRWDFRGIGENVNGSLFSQCPKCFSVAGVCGCPETSGRVQ